VRNQCNEPTVFGCIVAVQDLRMETGYGVTFEDLSPWTFDKKQQLLAELELSRWVLLCGLSLVCVCVWGVLCVCVCEKEREREREREARRRSCTRSSLSLLLEPATLKQGTSPNGG
jgi:hypothetical protein